MFKVVLLEDDEWVIKGIQRSFQWNKFDMQIVKTFLDPFELIEYVKYHEIDVIFTDIKMPGMSGLDLIQKIRLEMGRYEIEFVIISAYDDYDYMRKAINYGVIDYCRKPIKTEHTDEILEKIMVKLSARQKNTEDATYYTQDFEDLIQYINRNYSKELRLKNLAKSFFFNQNYLGLLFKKNMGMTFSEYLQKIRMEHAKEMFETTSHSIADVAAEVGFNDYSYFHKIFTSYYGITPAEYKKKFTKLSKEEKHEKIN